MLPCHTACFPPVVDKHTSYRLACSVEKIQAGSTWVLHVGDTHGVPPRLVCLIGIFGRCKGE